MVASLQRFKIFISILPLAEEIPLFVFSGAMSCDLFLTLFFHQKQKLNSSKGTPSKEV